MRKAIGEAHRRDARMINFREGWQGYLWQGRFSSFVMDEQYLLAAVRYIELNPVRAGLVTDPIAYPWGSARAHTGKHDDVLVNVSSLLELVPNWKEFLKGGIQEKEYQKLRQHERTGRPLGVNRSLTGLMSCWGYSFGRKRPDRKGHGKTEEINN